jgi:RNA polymerase sigma-70 factor (ECF subfamily)
MSQSILAPQLVFGESEPSSATLELPRDRNVREVNRGEQPASNRLEREHESEQDRRLIMRAQAGEATAFRLLVERHQRRVFAIALGLVRDEQDAREIAQEAFLRVHKGLSQFHGGSSFFTWLYRIVTNLSIDLMRKPSRREAELHFALEIDDSESSSLVPQAVDADPFDVVRRGQLSERIQVALEALPPYHRGVILMREVEGLSYEEMAEAMQVSKGTIMSRLFHARKKLQRALSDCHEEECPGAKSA